MNVHKHIVTTESPDRYSGLWMVDWACECLSAHRSFHSVICLTVFANETMAEWKKIIPAALFPKIPQTFPNIPQQ